MKTIQEQIADLKKDREAIILAHNYTMPEVQDIADFVGDSLELSKKAAKCEAKTIVFCGVRFMAETAKILNPEATVLLANNWAGCPMADMVSAEAIREYKKANPDAIIVAYVNTTAETKTEVDICCTSSNATKIIESIPKDKKILFVPDQNLGSWVRYVCDRDNIELWPGFCPTHNKIMPYQVEIALEKHPDAEVMVHPECRPDVEMFSNYTLSTGEMLKLLNNCTHKEWIVGTEANIIHRMKKEHPDMNFYTLDPEIKCPNMRKITLENVLFCMQDMQPEIVLSDEVMEKARKPIDKMLGVK